MNRRRSRKERAAGDTAAVRRMAGYAMARLQRSGGAPVSLNQSAMAAEFRQPLNPGSPPLPGPSQRTITRSWPTFAARMKMRGYKLVRAHCAGVNLAGKRPQGDGQRQSKLGWIIHSEAWERRGGRLLHFIPKARRKPGRGPTLRPRWLRDERRNLIPPPPPGAVRHCANSDPVPLNPPIGGRKNPEKQSARGTSGPSKDGRGSNPPAPKVPKARWQVPQPVLRALWGLARRFLGANAPPLVARALGLWKAGYPAGALFCAVRRAASWAGEARTGDPGKIAAAVLAGRLMRPDAPPHRPPSGQDFHRWVRSHAPGWRRDAASRAGAYRTAQAEDFASQLGISRDELRARLAASLGGDSKLDVNTW